jgi:lysozyme family protein
MTNVPAGAAFDAALAFVLEHEGGDKITDDPRDPGGLTRYGICQRSYPGLDIRNLTRADAAAIYARDYWQASRCDKLPPTIAFMHFDCSVNQGVGAAAKLLQEALGVIPDGKIGPNTIAAALMAKPIPILIEYAARRGKRYADNPNFDRFGLGWLRRLSACLAHSLEQ